MSKEKESKKNIKKAPVKNLKEKELQKQPNVQKKIVKANLVLAAECFFILTLYLFN